MFVVLVFRSAWKQLDVVFEPSGDGLCRWPLFNFWPGPQWPGQSQKMFDTGPGCHQHPEIKIQSKGTSQKSTKRAHWPVQMLHCTVIAALGGPSANAAFPFLYELFTGTMSVQDDGFSVMVFLRISRMCLVSGQVISSDDSPTVAATLLAPHVYLNKFR